jgi:hypothetical protein
MHPSNIVRVGAVCAALVVGACGFSPGQGASGVGGGAASGGRPNVGGFGGTSSGSAGMTGSGGGVECGAFDKPSSKLPPDILIVLDASGSMDQDATNAMCSGGCGAMSKWALMTPAINTVVQQTETDVNWGLKFFADMGTTCGVAANTVAVNVAPMNAAMVASAITGRTSGNGGVANGSRTPTRAGENAAVTYLTGLADTNPKFIVLATDGSPNCPATGSTDNDDTAGAVGAVRAAKTAGIPTFVVGISAGGAPEMALNMMAVEGGYPQVGQPTQYYPVSSTNEFAAVLRTLVGMASTCTFSVPPPPTNDGTTSRGDIAVKGTSGGAATTIPLDGTNGWSYTDASMTSIVLHGTACDQVTAGTITTVTIVFHCHLT